VKVSSSRPPWVVVLLTALGGLLLDAFTP